MVYFWRFLAKRSSGSDVHLKEVQDSSQDMIDVTPPADVVISGRLIEPEPQLVVVSRVESDPQPVVEDRIGLEQSEVVEQAHDPDPDPEPISQGVVNEVIRSPEHALHRSSRLNPVPLLRRSSRIVRALEMYTPMRWINLVEASVLDTNDLMTYEKVMDSPDSDK